MADPVQPKVGPALISHCPECAYPLTGLSPAGHCPECGCAYDPQVEAVVYGWGSGRKVRAHNSRTAPTPREHVRYVVLMIGVMGLYVAVSSYTRGRLDLPGAVFWMGFCLVSAGYTLYRRLTAPSLPAPVAVRVGPLGYCQRDGVGPPDWKRWTRGDVVEVISTESGFHRLRIAGSKPTHLFDGDAVDVLLALDEAEAGELRSRLKAIQRLAADESTGVNVVQDQTDQLHDPGQ